MRSKCKQCGKPHNKYTLDIMTATKIPKDYCSDFCHNLALMDRLPTDQKDFAYIKCTNAESFRDQKYVKIGDEVFKLEHVFVDGIEISKPKGSYETIN